MVTLIGMGAGLPGSLTAEGLAALQQADLILGARRLLEHLPDGCTEHRKALYKPEEILTCLAEHPDAGKSEKSDIQGYLRHFAARCTLYIA